MKSLRGAARSTTGLACLVLLAVAARAAADPASSHTGVLKTKRFELRFRSGSRAAADVPRQAVAAERDLDRIAAALDTTPKGPFVLRLYEDVEDLSSTTKTNGNAGFSIGNTRHVPYDNGQKRLDELVTV